MDFGRQFRKGTIITIISQVIKVVIGLVITAILSRLLTPDEYGIVAIIFIFLNLFDLFSNVGFGVGIIQYKDLTDKEISCIHILSIGLSIAMMLLFIICSPAIVVFYREPLYYRLIPVVSLNVLLSGLRVVPEALIRKNLQFKKLNTFFLISDILGGICAILLAYLGWGVYALILKSIITNVGLIIMESIHPEFTFSWSTERKGLGKLFFFSFHQFIFNIINYLTRNLDDLLIGRLSTAYQLGIYDRAYKLAKYPLDNVKGIMTNVLYPLLSLYQENLQELYALYLKVLQLFLLLFIPLTAVLAAMGEEIIIILYGDAWSSTIPIFQILALSIWTQVISSMASIYLQSISRTDLLVKTGIYLNVFTVLGIITGLFYGILGVSIGFSVGYYMGSVLSFRLVFKTMNKGIGDFMQLLFKPVMIAAFNVVIIYIIKFLIPSIVLRVFVEALSVLFMYGIVWKKLNLAGQFKEIFH